MKRKLEMLTKRLGASAVICALIANDLSPRQADLLAKGDHKGKFRRKTVAAVMAVLAEAELGKAS